MIDIGAIQGAEVGKMAGHAEQEAATRIGEAFVREAVTKAMAEIKAIITIIVEAIKFGSLPITNSKK